MAKSKPNRWRYWVRGGGRFPLDMLRHDCCWPATPDGTAKISIIGSVGHRSVEIMGTEVPAVDRWKSFGWTVLGDPLAMIA